MSNPIKIAIADDEQLFRQGVKNMLSKQEDFKVLYDLENGQALLERLRTARSKPDIVITDLNMPEMDGVELTKIISKEFPNIKIITLTGYFTKTFVLNMLSIGAVGYLTKNSTPELMFKTIRAVHKNGYYYDNEIKKYADQLKVDKPKKSRSPFDKNLFTKRELEVLELICQQYQASEIAEILSISKRTVDVHRKNLLLKSEAKNIAGLVVYAIKHKLITLYT